MLTRAAFTNFKALKDVAVDLSPFTVIVGKNGSGKTSVLQGIHDLVQLLDAQAAAFTGANDPQRLVTRPRSGPIRFELADDGGHTFAVEGRFVEEDGAVNHLLTATLSGVSPATADMPDQAQWSQTGSDAIRRREAWRKILREVRKLFGSAILLRLDPRVMVRESAAATEEPRLQPDGEGLATVLNSLAGATPSILEEIRRDLSAVVPQVRGIRTFPTRLKRMQRERVTIGDQVVYRTFEEEVAGYRFALDMGAGRLIEADLLSEGTVLALGLLTALRHPQCPRLVLLDDVDAALHSSAQAELVRAIRAILAARPELQIICTSHSADLLDRVSFEEIRVMALGRDGYARCGRLSDHPESEKWRKMLRTGEFWASVGEDWLLTGSADGQ